jgi:predicted ferric reductase
MIARHVTYISKLILHPSKVLEVQIKKENINPKAGQYIFISCPEISYLQYHPFTLTSAPEEDYVSVHVRIAGDWTTVRLVLSLLPALFTSSSSFSFSLPYFVCPPRLLDRVERLMAGIRKSCRCRHRWRNE